MDPAEIGKIIAVDLPVVGDAKQALEMLLAEPVVKNNTEKWIEKVKKDKERVRSYDKKERMVQPQAVIERIGELTDGDAVVVTDVGQHQMWTAQYYPYQNERQLVTSVALELWDLVFQQQLVLKLLILIKKLSSLLVMVVSK